MDDIRAVREQACREAGAQLDSANTMTGTVAPDVCQVDTVNAAGSHRRLDTDNSAFDWGAFSRYLASARCYALGWTTQTLRALCHHMCANIGLFRIIPVSSALMGAPSLLCHRKERPRSCCRLTPCWSGAL